VDVEASQVNSAAEASATRIMIDRVEEKYDMKPARLVGGHQLGLCAHAGVDGQY